jgi:hypothetical protein
MVSFRLPVDAARSVMAIWTRRSLQGRSGRGPMVRGPHPFQSACAPG